MTAYNRPDDPRCHCSTFADRTCPVHGDPPPLNPCTDHPRCAVDPLNGDHVDIDTGARAVSKNLDSGSVDPEIRTIDAADEIAARDCAGDCYRGHRCDSCRAIYAPFDAMPALYDVDAETTEETCKLPGWTFEYTGGNCTALARGYDRTGVYAWLLTGDGDAQAPIVRAQAVTLGCYDREDAIVFQISLPTVDAALIVVAMVEGADAGDILRRAISVIEEADPDAATDPEGHAPLLRELRQLIGGGQ